MRHRDLQNLFSTSSDASDVERVVATLRAAIIDGALSPGTPLRQGRVASELGVRRVLVRRAMDCLVVEGLLSTVHGRRAVVVAPVGSGAVDEVMSVRVRIEPYAVERSLPVFIADSFGRLEILLEQLVRSVQSEPLSTVADAHLALHRAFYEQADHRLLFETWLTLENVVRQNMQSACLLIERGEMLIHSHRALIDTLKSGSSAEITRHVSEHVSGSERRRPAGNSEHNQPP